MNIKKDMNITEILNNYPETKSVFINAGFKGLDNNEVLAKLSTITLEEAMKLKKSDVDSFIKMLEEAITRNQEIDNITLKESKKASEGVTVTGLLPCPVRIPLLEGFKKFLEENSDVRVSYELKAASAGLNWLKEDVIKADNIDKLSDMFISAGFDLFFEKELMGKFKERKIFKDITGIKKYNKEFIDLKDPYGDYSMIGVVPAIFLVNTNNLNGMEIPKTWEDILKPEFERKISLPVADFDLFNAILVNIYKNYGEEAVRRLGKNLMSSMHPAEMLGSNGPTVTIMPYFFSKMIKKDGPMIPIWPEDGAIISPIFMLTKAEKKDELKKIAEFMSGESVGTILSHQGLFPSVNPKVKNVTEGKPMMWVGWDYIYSNNIGEIIRNCEKIFNEGVEG